MELILFFLVFVPIIVDVELFTITQIKSIKYHKLYSYVFFIFNFCFHFKIEKEKNKRSLDQYFISFFFCYVCY